jgi:phosphatidylglycerophosphate synthase
MIDNYLRRRLEGPLDRCAGLLDVAAISPDRVTAAGLVLGLSSALSAGLQLWWLALVLWLASRLADGLDGPLARRRARAGGPNSGAGGFFDITADFTVYGATVVGVAVGVTSGYDAPWWPFLLVLLAYYINGTAFLAFSSIAERTDRKIDDGRSLSFLGGVAEGAETIAVHSIWLILPGHAWQIAVVWAGVVAVSAGQRIIAGHRALS